MSMNVMSAPRYRLACILALSGVIALGAGIVVGSRFALKKEDARRLESFAQRIADADRVVASLVGRPVTVTWTGDDARKVVQAVGSAHSARAPGTQLALAYGVKATFFKDTNQLDDVEIGGPVFMLHYSDPPFRDGTGVMQSLFDQCFSRTSQQQPTNKLETQ